MDRAARAIATQIRKGKGFANNTLSSKGRITMQKNAQHFGAVMVVTLLLFSPHPSNNNRINNFQMRWVWCQTQMHRAIVKNAISRCTHVIFYVTRPTHIFGICRIAQKFGNDRPKRLA